MARHRYRRHGFQCPWSKLQVSSWLCLLFQGAVMFTLILPDLERTALAVVSAAYSFTYGAILVCGFASTALNPTDPGLLHAISAVSAPKTVFTEEPKTASQKLCIKCEAYVGQKSKHCGVCNRCTAGFDHHCGWLNNCVGRRNYPWFIALVCSIEMTAVIQCYCGSYLLHLLLEDGGAQLLARHSFQEGGYMYMTCIFLFVALSLPILFSNGFLICFHIYLKVNHITTYDFILARRLQRAKVHPSSIAESGAALSSGGTKPDAVYRVPKVPMEEIPEQSFTFRDRRKKTSTLPLNGLSKEEEEAEDTRDFPMRGLSESQLKFKVSAI